MLGSLGSSNCPIPGVYISPEGKTISLLKQAKKLGFEAEHTKEKHLPQEGLYKVL